jgi:hypothetical protein
MKNRVRFIVGTALLLGSLTSQALDYFTLSPLGTFGGGDGWLSPGEGGYAYLGTGNNERGLAYGNGHVYLVSRANVGGNALNIRMLNNATGADLGGLAIGSGIISGGLFPINTIGVSGDGAIYVNNMTSAAPANGNFRVYRWANEAATPTVAYNGAPLTGARIGDSIALIGSGSSTLLAAGYNTSPSIAGNNGYAIIDPTLGTATHMSFTGTPPNAGDFRLGLTFSDSSHVLGTQGSSLYRYSSFSGGSGTLLSSPAIPDPAGATADRLLGYTVLAGKALLAVQSTGDSHVSVYDAANPSTPIWLASGNNTSGTLTANGNGTGQIAWGDPVYDSLSGRWSVNLYAMSSNQGIQAFIVTIPEPGAASLAALGLGLLGFWRKLRK